MKSGLIVVGEPLDDRQIEWANPFGGKGKRAAWAALSLPISDLQLVPFMVIVMLVIVVTVIAAGPRPGRVQLNVTASERA